MPLNMSLWNDDGDSVETHIVKKIIDDQMKRESEAVAQDDALSKLVQSLSEVKKVGDKIPKTSGLGVYPMGVSKLFDQLIKNQSGSDITTYNRFKDFNLPLIVKDLQGQGARISDKDVELIRDALGSPLWDSSNEYNDAWGTIGELINSRSPTGKDFKPYLNIK